MIKLLFNFLMMSVLMIGCAKEDEDTVADDSSYKSCYIVDLGVNICYDLSDSGASHSEVALACEQFSGSASSDVCSTSYDGKGSVGLCTGITLTDEGNSVNFANVKARYYIASDAEASQQSACVGENGNWNAGE